MKNKQNYNPVCSMLNCPPQGCCILQNIKVTHNSRKLSIKRLAIDPEEWNYLQKHRKYCREIHLLKSTFAGTSFIAIQAEDDALICRY